MPLPFGSRVASALRQWRCLPPDLPAGYTIADFRNFARAETPLFSAQYARRRVVIEGRERLQALAANGGGILAFLHYGSFFLSGVAIAHQLGLAYTAIASRRNFAEMSGEDVAYWQGVHHRVDGLYRRPMFFTDEPALRPLRWLKQQPGALLGVALDVREHGQAITEYPFHFLGGTVYMQTGPARLAGLARLPLMPMTIRYHREERRHHLYFGAPIAPTVDPLAMTQEALDALAEHVRADPAQQFGDIAGYFSTPHSP